jgi:stringent starvation protein B
MAINFQPIKKTLKQHTLHAFYSWAAENGFTPMVYVVNNENCMVPPSLSKSPHFWLNLHPDAIRNYEETTDGIFFTARFSGNPFKVYIEWPSIIGVKVAENNDFATHLMDYPDDIQSTQSTQPTPIAAEQVAPPSQIQGKKPAFKPVVLSGGKDN